MRTFGHKCDSCGHEFRGDPPIVLTGVTDPRRGGILLPERLKETTFCGKECFLVWAKGIPHD